MSPSPSSTSSSGPDKALPSPAPMPPRDLAAEDTPSTTGASSNPGGLRQRPVTAKNKQHGDVRTSSTPKSSLRDSQDLKQAVPSGDTGSGEAAMSFTKRNQWVVFAVASGACAAFNGVFAKLTTNDLTTTIAKGISRLFGMPEGHVYIELVVRVIFFSLNLVFNGVMWTLFTQALAKGNSTTQVSIMNTSTNFMITALLGFIIFSESLPPLWWLGAAMLVAGNVIIGRKDSSGSADEAEEVDGAGAEGGGVLGAGAGLAAADALGEYRDDDTDVYRDDLETGRQSDDVDEDVALIGDL